MLEKMAGREEFPELSDPYLGQKPPGKTPELFAPGINTSAKEAFPFVSFDGKYLFFMSSRISELNTKPIPDGPANVYWVDAGIVEEFRPKNLKRRMSE